MRALLFKYLADLRASYWFLPSCLVIGSAILAFVMLQIDRSDPRFLRHLPEVLTDTRIEGARSVLAVIAQSVIGVTGVMFSITMVAVSFASGNFGPRLIGNFMRDRGNQWSLAILIATFVYALFILRSLHGTADGAGDDFVPQASLIVAMALTIISVFVMIYFVHHVPETINVSNIAAVLGGRFRDALVRTARHRGEGDGPAFDEDEALTVLALDKAGYVQQLAVDELQKHADKHDLRIRLLTPPGRFVHHGYPVIEVAGEVSDEVARKLRACFALGTGKTEDQNLLFLADQQVEMIARALSPGVNDPYTAVNCMNWMAAAIAAGARQGDMFGLAPQPRVAVPALDLPTLLARTFGAAYPYVRDDPMAEAHWKSLLTDLEGLRMARLTQAISTMRRDALAGDRPQPG